MEGAVDVPVRLLLSRNLTASAKVVWSLVRFLGQVVRKRPTIRSLAAQSGQGRNTVRRGLAALRKNGWLIQDERGLRVCLLPSTSQDNVASIPGELLTDPRVTTQAKLMFAYLQLTRAYRYSGGHFTYGELCELAGISRNTARRAVNLLSESQWLRTWQRNRLRPVVFRLRNPFAEERMAELEAAEERLDRARFTGEQLMREYLNLLVESDRYEDDASAGHLPNPITGAMLRYDRFYPPDVAFSSMARSTMVQPTNTTARRRLSHNRHATS